MMTGVVVVAAFGLAAATGLGLVVALFRVSGRPLSGTDGASSAQKGS
jgi:hypothetical protein